MITAELNEKQAPFRFAEKDLAPYRLPRRPAARTKAEADLVNQHPPQVKTVAGRIHLSLRSPVLAEIERLDATRDHSRITFLTSRVDFPWDTARALEFALLRIFSIPVISALLDRTQEFELRAPKCYGDLDNILSELMEHGYDSPRGRAALQRMNAIHGRFQILNIDSLYMLSTFVFVPIRWNERFGWRRMLEKERLAQFHFWREVGRRMHIEDLPADYAEFERFNVEYEYANFRFTDPNGRVGTALRELFKSRFPGWTRPLVEKGLHALMDKALLQAFGFPEPSPMLRCAVAFGLKARAWALRGWPRRRRPLLRTEMGQPSCPEGYVIGTLWPEELRQGGAGL